MKNKEKRVLIYRLSLGIALIGICIAIPAFASDMKYKKLGVPPEEMSKHKLPDPSDLGIRSKTLISPIYLKKSNNETYIWEKELYLGEEPDTPITFISANDSNWEYQAVGIDKKSEVIGDKAHTPAIGLTKMGEQHAKGNGNIIGFDQSGYKAQLFKVTRNKNRNANLQISTREPGTVRDSHLPQGFLMFNPNTNYGLYSYMSTVELLSDKKIGLVAYLYDKAMDLPTSRMKPSITRASVKKMTMQLFDDSGANAFYDMYDDGLHDDGEANDGKYGVVFDSLNAGNYTAMIQSTLEDSALNRIELSSIQSFPIIDSNFIVKPQSVPASLNTEGRLEFNIDIQALSDSNEHISAYAELWTVNPQGKGRPIAWFGGGQSNKIDSTTKEMVVDIDVRWLARAYASKNLELRNFRIVDLNNNIPQVKIESMPVVLTDKEETKLGDIVRIHNPKGLVGEVPAINKEMRSGEKPTEEVGEFSASASNLGLLLVHGYCAGSNPWPTGDFSSSNLRILKDFNANRNHRDFAQYIKQLGGSLNGYGIIAHSQGGAAALTLYAHYWSPLDNVDEGSKRIIQSVGTPYGGTALAGLLSFLGLVFDHGCGYNFDLTYVGAALWWSGIPISREKKVHYYETTFKDKWWRYDYCDIVTDPVLWDPEDGVTEAKWGHLYYGQFEGLKSGWCHTNKMRDPHQTTDHNRNASMNSYSIR